MGLNHHEAATEDNKPPSSSSLPSKQPSRQCLQKPLPAGWDVGRVNRLLENYHPLLQQYAEDNHAQNDADIRMNIMKVPEDLVPAVREMIEKYKAA